MGLGWARIAVVYKYFRAVSTIGQISDALCKFENVLCCGLICCFKLARKVWKNVSASSKQS
jgi:hypothetical protein